MSARDDACWVVTPGHAGMENQAVGLAEAVGLPFAVKRVRPRPPWTWLPVGTWPAPLRALDGSSDRLAPPWPDLLIAAGRRSIPYALHVGRASRSATFTVYVQDPRIRPDRFDLVAAPRHDRISGENVTETIGALHRVTPRRLADEAARIAPALSSVPKPRVAVLIGGSNSCYRMTTDRVRDLAQSLKAMAERDGAGLLVTPSRRTGAQNLGVIEAELADVPALIWDFQSDNPYFGYLGLADAVVVTCDSVSMVSEACATGKPVMVAELDGGNRKFTAFHAASRAAGYTRPFRGQLETWATRPLDDTGRVAAEVRRRMSAGRAADASAATGAALSTAPRRT